MTTQLSNLHKLPIVTVGASILAQAASAMGARTWAEFDGGTHNGVAMPLPANAISLGFGFTDASSDGQLAYANSGWWNPIANRVDYLGGGHGGPGAYHTIFDAATHSCGHSQVPNGPTSHEFDHTIGNPFTGVVYQRDENQNGHAGRIYSIASYGSAPVFLKDQPAGVSLTGGTGWWNSGFAGAGAQGCMVLCQARDFAGSLDCWDPITNTFFNHRTLPGYSPGDSGSNHHSILTVSQSKQCAVFGGFNAYPNNLWRLNADGTVEKYAASTAVPVGITRGMMTEDPITGNFLVNSANGFYEFNPTGAGAWTLLTGRPGNVNTNVIAGGNGTPGFAWVSIAGMNVVLAISASPGVCRMHLYKHG